MAIPETKSVKNDKSTCKIWWKTAKLLYLQPINIVLMYKMAGS